MKKVIFLSFDFGLKSDYENFYKWLDENGAVERGYGLAYIKEYVIKTAIKSDKDFAKYVQKEIKERVKLTAQDRIYMIWNGIEEKTKVKSGFLFGSPKQSPWTGFAKSDDNDLDLDF